MKHLVSTSFAVAFAAAFALGGVLVGTGIAQISTPPAAPTTHGADPHPTPSSGNPWQRCLAAMEDAQIPGWMWECHEAAAEPLLADVPTDPYQRCEWLLAWPDRVSGGEAYPYRVEACSIAIQPIS